MAMEIRDVTVVPEGDGVEVKRLFPLPKLMNFDPFVLWDHFEIGPGHGFPDHPHRGFEAITYMFAGGMNHKDNLGNESFVTSGGAQRFTAGGGIIHSEMPAEQHNSNGIQLWINLPKYLKNIEPSYQQVNSTEFPVEKVEGGAVKHLVGEGSPLKIKTDIIYQHVTLNRDATYNLQIKPGMRGLIYLIDGSITANQHKVKMDQALFIEDTDKIELHADVNSEFLICMGMAHKEPIHQHGPFVD